MTIDLLSDFLNFEIDCFYRLPQKTSDKLYKVAYIYYQNRYYQESDAIFRILVKADPENFDYWKGLGACLQMKKNYQAALECYTRAQTLKKGSPDLCLQLHRVDCFLALQEVEKALKALKATKTQAKELKNKAILEHVAFMEKQWNPSNH